MTRETSAEAFRALIATGELKGKQREVAAAFAEHGPGTSAEVLRAAGLDRNVNLMRARVTELTDAGVLRESGVRKCKITGRNALVFAFAPGGPRRTPRKGATFTHEQLQRYGNTKVDEATARIAAWLCRGAESLGVDGNGTGRVLVDAAKQILDGAWK